MVRLFLLFFFSLFSFSFSISNDFPIVLVHGLGGWGRDELFGVKYWGGLHDIEEDIINSFPGAKVFTVSMGPVSSSWDRTCELYAQIKGGTVDYGAYHAKKFGHQRFGRTYQGFYPEWGTVNADGKVNKIHLLSHSMGGLDIRLLTQLLHFGDLNEKSMRYGHNQPPMSKLFSGGNDFVLGAISISTPHDGTTLATEASKFTSLIVDLVMGAAALNGAVGRDDFIYDFKLDQFGIFRKPNESFSSYADQIFKSSFWQPGFEDTALFDCEPAGASKRNPMMKLSPNVYYMSYSTADTYEVPVLKDQAPRASMLPLLWPFSTFMGSFAHDGFNSSWWQNDGVVNTCSMDGPKLASRDIVKQYDGTLYKGVFNHMKILDGYDHVTIIGLNIFPVLGIYRDLVSSLYSLSDD